MTSGPSKRKWTQGNSLYRFEIVVQKQAGSMNDIHRRHCSLINERLVEIDFYDVVNVHTDGVSRRYLMKNQQR
jgi:hypothetical protein